MKPPHSRRPGSAAGGPGSSGIGPSGKGPSGRPYTPRSGQPPRDARPARRDGDPGRERSADERNNGERNNGERNNGERSAGERPAKTGWAKRSDGPPRRNETRPDFKHADFKHADSKRDGVKRGEPKRFAPKRGEAPPGEFNRGGDRPRTERTLSIRPPADQPRPERGERPERSERPRTSRPPQDRPEQARAHSDRPRAAAPRRPSPPPADPDAPRGALWLYGTHAVAAALANPQRRLRRLLLTEEAEAAIAAKLPQPWPVAVERTDRARLDLLLGRDVVHQGVALLADPLAPPSLGGVLERPGPLLVLDQVGDPRNIGAILRAAAAFGVAAVIVQDRNSPEETGALAKAASGALETMPLLRAVNIARTIVALKAAGCWVIGLDAGGSVLSGPSLAERRVALVLGNEGDGLRRLTRDTCDEIAGIEMPGGGNGLDSLNVSAAAAVALYEIGRRR